MSDSGDAAFTPDPPSKMSLYQVSMLFGYHVLLALFLAYAIYNVWPQPWPAPPTAPASTGPTNPPSLGPSAGAPAGRADVTSGASGGVISGTAGSAAIVAAGGPVAVTAGSAVVAAGAGNASPAQASIPKNYPPVFHLFGWPFQPDLEARLLLLVMLAGAAGSYVHAATSLVDFLGNRKLVSSWVWWYLLRPFIGMMLALVFYFVFRGGFITATMSGTAQDGPSAATFINPFGIAALAGLVGMFSKVATDKLNEVFTTLFRPSSGQGDAQRGDSLAESVMTVGSVDPDSGSAGQIVTIAGTNFTAGTSVAFGGMPAVSVTVTGPSTLTVVAPAQPAGPVDIDVLSPNKHKITLKNGFTYTA